MPELPEVETIVRQLADEIPGRRFIEIEVHHQDLLREPVSSFISALEGQSILSVSRRGKNILLHLSSPGVLLVNLGMTGRLLSMDGSPARGTIPHLGVTFLLEPKGSLLYVDPRRFGHLTRHSMKSWRAESRRLGPEPLGRGVTGSGLHAALIRSRSPIRSWLLDQTRLAGIGNIYANESLFRAGVHPARPANSLSLDESKTLLACIRAVLREAVRARGTTLRDYRTASGDAGGFAPGLQVYGREGEECSVCKTSVERVVFGNRSAFFCSRCQPQLP
jgi:formamidopyrimidine-DNA glycosylase